MSNKRSSSSGLAMVHNRLGSGRRGSGEDSIIKTDESYTSDHSHSLYSGTNPSLYNPISPIGSYTSSLKSSMINSRDKEYAATFEDSPPRNPQLSLDNSVTSSGIVSMHSRSSKYRPSHGNRSVTTSRGSLDGDGSLSSGHPISTSVTSLSSLEKPLMGRPQGRTTENNVEHAYDQIQNPSSYPHSAYRHGHVHNLEPIRQEPDHNGSDDDDSLGTIDSNLSDIMMRPSSSTPCGTGVGIFQDPSFDCDSDRSESVNLGRVLQQLDDFSGESDDEDTWSVSDKSGMSSNGNAPQVLRNKSDNLRHKSKDQTPQKLQVSDKLVEDDYYKRIRESTVSAYVDDRTASESGSECLDVLGSIPDIFPTGNFRSRDLQDVDNDDDLSGSHDSNASSGSDDQRQSKGPNKSDKTDRGNPGVITARAIRPGSKKANRPTRKKPPPKPPVNPLIFKSDSSLSNSQLSVNTHSDGGSTVLARHGAQNHNGSFISGGLRRVGDSQAVAGGLRRVDDASSTSSRRISVSGGLRKVEGGGKDVSKSFFGRSMLMLKMLTSGNAPSSSSHSLSPTTSDVNVSQETSQNTRGNALVGSQQSSYSRKNLGHRRGTASSLLSADGAESVHSVDTADMMAGQLMRSTSGSLSGRDEMKARNAMVRDDSKRSHTSDGSNSPDKDKMKAQKFDRMMMMKRQQSSRRGELSFKILKTNSSRSSDNNLKRRSSMAMMVKKANQLNSVGSTVNVKSFDRKSSAMVMNMKGIGMNMAAINKNLSRTVSTTSAPKSSHHNLRALNKRQYSSFGGSTVFGDEDTDKDKTVDKVEDEDETLLELDCGPTLENPILSYKQAQRVRAFHMPGLIDADTMTLIQHPLSSKFGWFEFPFRKVFAKNPSPSDFVIEKYGIGMILWFRFLVSACHDIDNNVPVVISFYVACL